MYNPSLDVETKMDVALALLKPKSGRKRKRLEAFGSEDDTDDESDTEDDEFSEADDPTDDGPDPDYIPKPKKAGPKPAKSSIVSTNFNPLQGGSKKYIQL